MPNYIWFLILVLFGVLLIVYTLFQTKLPRIRLLFVFFAIAGMAYIFEYVIFILFHSYDYYLRIFPEHWVDSTWGAIASQAMIVPAISMSIVAFNLKVYGMLGFIFLLMGIEELFLWLGIYEHNWWSTWYTGFFLLICFIIGKWWYKQLSREKRWIEWAALFLTLIFLNHSLAVITLSFWESHTYSPEWFANDVRDTLAFGPIIVYPNAILATLIIKSWFHWYSLLSLYLVNVFLMEILEWLGLVHFSEGWNSFLFALIPLVCIMIPLLMYRHLLKR